MSRHVGDTRALQLWQVVAAAFRHARWSRSAPELDQDPDSDRLQQALHQSANLGLLDACSARRREEVRQQHIARARVQGVSRLGLDHSDLPPVCSCPLRLGPHPTAP